MGLGLPEEAQSAQRENFVFVDQTYFKVEQEFLKGFMGLSIHQKARRREDTIVICNAYGESLIKATFPGSGWTYYHDKINKKKHKIIRRSEMVNQMEIEYYYFIRKVRGMAISRENTVLIQSKHL